MARKSLTIGVVALLFGVAFAPSLFADVETTSEKQELVEISVELFGLKEKKSQNMTLTINDANKLYSYLEGLECQLSNSTLYGEVIDIFNEVIDELEKYSLLDSLSIDEIRKIVEKNYNLIKKANLANNLFDKNEEHFFNALCLISGFTSQTESSDFFVYLGNILMYAWYFLAVFLAVFLAEFIPFLPIDYLILFFAYLKDFAIDYLMPFRILGKIEIGRAYYDLDYEVLRPYIPAEGWVITLGITGLKVCNEPKWGKLRIFDISKAGPAYAAGTYFTGAVGFTGLIVKLFDKKFYIGNALVVDIGP